MYNGYCAGLWVEGPCWRPCELSGKPDEMLGGGGDLAMDLHVIPGDGKGVVTLRLHGPLGWSPVFFLLTR